jgi:pimeloyl-ACP methyl ester carboxylesterase
MATNPTVILVHGAFADASGFAGVIRELQAQGVDARAPMNPLRSLAFDADAVARYASTIDGPIVLCGHSYGGAVISQAAPAVEDTVALVYFAALTPDAGESCVTVQEGFPPPPVGSSIVPSPYDAPGAPGGPDLFIKIADFHEMFCADLPDDVAAPMAVSQRPVSAAAFGEKATAAGWKDYPTWYMVSEHDKTISPDCERFMADRMKAHIAVASGGSHAAFIAQPKVAANFILKAIRTP